MSDDVEVVEELSKSIRPTKENGDPLLDDDGEPVVVELGTWQRLRIPLPDEFEDIEVEVPKRDDSNE